MTSVAFLGPLGTYSHQVVSSYFGKPGIELVPQSTIALVFHAVARGEATYGVVPVENSTFGPVSETVLEMRTTGVVARDMIKLSVGHALMGKEDTGCMIDTIYSHEQGLGQCKQYLEENYPKARLIKTSSTAQAALMVQHNERALAICSEMCAEVYNLVVIEEEIQDGGKENITRFLIIALPGTPLNAKYPIIPPSDLE